jgi:HD-like signal output (HDOD) protein
MSQMDAVSTIESRAIPNTVVFGFVKALALELSRGRVDLPSVPEIVLKIQRVLANESVSNEIVVQVLSAEPVLAGKLLNMANSAALNSSGRKIADLRTAVARVGFNIVRSAALSFAIEQLRAAVQFKHLEPMLDALWKHSVHVAALSHVVARRFTSLNGDTALLAGLMHNVGRIYILTRASTQPALYNDQLTYQSIVRDWHTNVAKALLENWQVADEIIDAVGNHEDLNREVRGPVTLTDVVALSTLLQQHIGNGALRDPTEPLVWASKRLQVRYADCQSVIDESATDIEALKAVLGG